MDTVKDLIEKLELLPPDMPLESVMPLGIHLIEGRLVVSHGTSQDNVNLLWLRSVTPEMKDAIYQCHLAASEILEAKIRLSHMANSITKR